MQLIEVFIIFIILLPTSILIHELGHAIGILSISNKAEADIFFGSRSKEKKLNLKIGRVNFYLTIAISGFCFVSNLDKIPPLSNKQRLIIDSGGPLASLTGFILFYMCSYVFSGELSTFFIKATLLNFGVFITSALPYKYTFFSGHLAGYPTDGLRILYLIKEMRKNKTVV